MQLYEKGMLMRSMNGAMNCDGRTATQLLFMLQGVLVGSVN